MTNVWQTQLVEGSQWCSWNHARVENDSNYCVLCVVICILWAFDCMTIPTSGSSPPTLFPFCGKSEATTGNLSCLSIACRHRPQHSGRGFRRFQGQKALRQGRSLRGLHRQGRHPRFRQRRLHRGIAHTRVCEVWLFRITLARRQVLS